MTPSSHGPCPSGILEDRDVSAQTKSRRQEWLDRSATDDEEVDTPMHAIDAFPLHVILAALLWLLSAGALWQGMRHLATGLRAIDHPTSSLRVVRGLRGV